MPKDKGSPQGCYLSTENSVTSQLMARFSFNARTRELIPKFTELMRPVDLTWGSVRPDGSRFHVICIVTGARSDINSLLNLLVNDLRVSMGTSPLTFVQGDSLSKEAFLEEMVHYHQSKLPNLQNEGYSDDQSTFVKAPRAQSNAAQQQNRSTLKFDLEHWSFATPQYYYMILRLCLPESSYEVKLRVGQQLEKTIENIQLFVVEAEICDGFQLFFRSKSKDLTESYFFSLQERLEAIGVLTVKAYGDLEEMRTNVIYACMLLLASPRQSFPIERQEYNDILQKVNII